jgi:hypothetical protein
MSSKEAKERLAMRSPAFSKIRALLVVFAAAAGLNLVAPAASAAPVSIDLCAKAGSLTLPGPTTVAIWGFGIPSTPGDCGTATAQLPGPVLGVKGDRHGGPALVDLVGVVADQHGAKVMIAPQAAQVVDAAGVPVGKPFSANVDKQQTVHLQTNVAQPKLWTAETPNLYRVKLTLIKNARPVHSVVERFGFRTFEVRKGDGLYLNGQRILLKGVNRHSFWPETGRALNKKISYGDVFLQAEQEYSRYNFEHADTALLLDHFRDAEKECRALLAKGENGGRHALALPAYDQAIKASHIFNLLDARGVISVTERQAYILRVRDLAKACCAAWLKTEAGGNAHA